MNISLLALWSDSLTYTVARALAFSGHRVQIWIADVERDRQSDWSLSRRIAAIPGVSVIADHAADPPEGIDQLIVQGHPLLLGYRHVLDQLAARAHRITAISYGDRSKGHRQAIKIQWKELRWYGRWFGKVKRVVYKDGYYPADLFSLFKSRRVVGFDAHSKFLQDEALFQAIHAPDWECESLRSIRANFLGSRDPDIRSRILHSAEPFFTAPPPSGTVPKQMLWHAYTDAQPAALGPQEFLDALTESDFTLAPPGYSLVTHRPIEALLRGSIPVLNADELDLYDLGLVDGVNCIAVPQGGWAAAMERITGMDESEVVAMRRNVKAMLADRVAYPALSRDMSRRLGLDD
jgi:hypothetical protein